MGGIERGCLGGVFRVPERPHSVFGWPNHVFKL
jgi:hypothetical protein